MKTKKIKISELTPDNINANKGTQRGSAMLERSLREYGAGRSVLVDKSGRIIAGNKTIEAAGSIGLEEAVVGETDGSKVVIVKRTDLDLDSPQARGLAIADNRVSEVGLEWDVDSLEQIGKDLDLADFWSDDELPIFDLETAGDADFPEMHDEPEVYTRTFNLSSSQVQIIDRALEEAGEQSKQDALTKICEWFLNDG